MSIHRPKKPKNISDTRLQLPLSTQSCLLFRACGSTHNRDVEVRQFSRYSVDQILRNCATQDWKCLKITLDGNRGKGVAATAEIPKCAIICDYNGEIYRFDEAEKLFGTMSKTEEKYARSYAVEYDELFGGKFYVFAHFEEEIQSFGRLLNHSALHPNCRVYPKYFEASRPRSSRQQSPQKPARVIVVETLRKILKGEELLWDYGPKYSKEPWFYTCHCRKCCAPYYDVTFIPNGRLGIMNLRRIVSL